EPWCLLRGLGDHRVARGKGGGDLAGEDGERKVPRADAGEDAAAVQLQLVALTGGTREQLGLTKMFSGLKGVIPAKVGSFAHLGHRVGVGTAALAHDARDEVDP